MKNVKLVFASDLAPIRAFAPLMERDPEAVYGSVLPVLSRADFRIVNLEAPLTDRKNYIVKSGAAFSGTPAHIRALEAGSFQAAVCANNHTFDCGPEGFAETAALLKSHSIVPVGAGRDLAEARKPFLFTVRGVRFALFAISEGEDLRGAGKNTPGVRPWEVEVLARQIRRARKTCDVILVSAHAGLEYQPYPSFYVYEAFRLWAEAGADIIIGHHPHVPQGMTVFGRTPAYFSLGNFVFYQPTDLYYRKIGYLVEIEASGEGVVSHRAVPYRIGDRGLRLLEGPETAEFETLFGKLSEPLADAASAKEAWHAVLDENGRAGFEAELEKILRTMREDPGKGAAMLRNRVTCMQHRTQWIDGLTRITDGTENSAPREYRETVRAYMTRKITG